MAAAEKPLIVYKIRRLHDGLYSTGGGSPSFNTKGKTWNTRGALSGHLACVRDYRYMDRYKGCEVVLIEIKPEELDTIQVSDWELAPNTIAAKKREEIRRLEFKAKQAEHERARLLARLAELDK